MTSRPGVDVVFEAWLKGIPSLAGVGVSMDKVPDPSTWSGSKFIRITVVGGSPDQDIPIHRAVIMIDCFAVRSNSAGPAWHETSSLAEDVLSACYGNSRRVVQAAARWDPVKVYAVSPVSEVRRIADDPGGLARYSFDVEALMMTPGFVPA